MTLMAGAMVTSCTDELRVLDAKPLPDPDKGQLVLFSAGNVLNGLTRAEVAPYMEREGRFVCKMYYHAKATDTDESDFDTEETPIMSWLRVNDDEGNSVYWNNQFPAESNDYPADREHPDYRDYGFDPSAQFFYWRNRLDHVFLAFADYNKLKTNTYQELTGQDVVTDADEEADPMMNVHSGSLFMYPQYDGVKTSRLEDKVEWVFDSYERISFENTISHYITNPEYDAEQAILLGEEYTMPAELPVPYEAFASYGDMAYYDLPITDDGKIDRINSAAPAIKDSIKAKINASKIISTKAKQEMTGALDYNDVNQEVFVKDKVTYRRIYWSLRYLPGEAKFDEDDRLESVPFSSPNTYVYCQRQRQNLIPQYLTSPANTFDLRYHEEMTSMADQPDPILAVTRMKPTGATQEANRVRLYFKHQFSQIQVNLTNAATNTQDIKPDNITSVELLGVSQRGYVYTTITPDGNALPATYEPVVISEFTKEQIASNQFGTSFPMFDMGTAKPTTSLKSFQAIAFGELKAIRITWHEEEYNPATGVGLHQATFRIPDGVPDKEDPNKKIDLRQLESGMRYIYDFELRRGTIAFIRTTIDGWMLDPQIDYDTSGYIQHEVLIDNGQLTIDN